MLSGILHFPGSHWAWEILRMLVTGNHQMTYEDMKQCHLELLSPSHLQQLPSPRVLGTHRRFYDLPSDFIINRRKLVLVVRDPRDVCVSQYNILLTWKNTLGYSGSFEGFVPLFLQGKGKVTLDAQVTERTRKES